MSKLEKTITFVSYVWLNFRNIFEGSIIEFKEIKR